MIGWEGEEALLVPERGAGRAAGVEILIPLIALFPGNLLMGETQYGSSQ